MIFHWMIAECKIFRGYFLYHACIRLCLFILPFFRIVRLLLHNFKNALASHRTIFRIPINRDRLFQRSDIVLSMNINACTALLRYLTYRASLATNNRTHHIACNENTQWKISLTSWTTARHAAVLRTTALTATLSTSRCWCCAA